MLFPKSLEYVESAAVFKRKHPKEALYENQV